MEYRGLLDVTNLIVASVARSVTRMGLSGELIISQVASEFAEADIAAAAKFAGLEVTGDSVQAVLDSFVSQMECKRKITDSLIKELPFSNNSWIVGLILKPIFR